MLYNFRSHAKGWLGILILVAVSIPFALWGIQNYTRSGSEKPLATVGDRPIVQAELNRAYQQRLNQLQAQFGEEFSPELVNEAQLRREILTQLVQQELLAQVVHKEGFQISDDQVLKVISQIPAFQTDGQFDKQAYQQALRAQGQTSNGFLALVKESLRREQLVKGIQSTALVDETEVRDLYRIFAQQRAADYLTLSLSKAVDQTTVTDEEIEAYYQAHTQLYQTPETVKVDYLDLNADAIAKAIQLQDSELRAFYESEIQRFTTAGKRRVSHILFEVPTDASDETRQAKLSLAKHTLSRLDQGEDFEQLAKELSEDPGSAKQGGDLGIINAGMIPGPFEDTVFALQAGQISDVVETEFGYHIVKVTEVSEEKVRPYESVKAEVEQAYRQHLAGEQFYQMGEQLRELTYQNPSVLDPAATELGLTIQHSDAFERNQGAGVAEDERIRQAAFSEEVLAGNNSDVIELEAGHAVVLRVVEHQPAKTQALADVRGAVEWAARREKASKALDEQAVQLLAQLQSGAELTTVAEESGADLTAQPAFRRNDNTVAPEIINQVFSMPRPVDDKAVYEKVSRANGDVSIVALKQVIPGQAAKMSAKDRQALTEFLRNSRAQSAMAALMSDFSQQFKVNIKPQEGTQGQ